MSPTNSFSGRHALVCGASAGIGRAAAFALAAGGAQLTLLARRTDRLSEMIPLLIEAGAESATALTADLDDRPGLAKALDGSRSDIGDSDAVCHSSHDHGRPAVHLDGAAPSTSPDGPVRLLRQLVWFSRVDARECPKPTFGELLAGPGRGRELG